MQRTNFLMQHNNLAGILNDSFTEFRSLEFRKHIRYIENKLWDQCPPTKESGIFELPDEAKAHVLPVLNFFGHVGTLLANGMISDDLVASYMGPTALSAWKYLSPYIRNVQRRHPDYHVFFENLAFVVKQYPPGTLRVQFNLQPMPDPVGPLPLERTS
jgi:hypothetical protein